MKKLIVIVGLLLFANIGFANEIKNVMIQSKQITGSPVYWNSGWDVARKTAQHQLNLEKALELFEYADFEVSEENCSSTSEMSEIPLFLCTVLLDAFHGGYGSGGSGTGVYLLMQLASLAFAGSITGFPILLIEYFWQSAGWSYTSTCDAYGGPGGRRYLGKSYKHDYQPYLKDQIVKSSFSKLDYDTYFSDWKTTSQHYKQYLETADFVTYPKPKIPIEQFFNDVSNVMVKKYGIHFDYKTQKWISSKNPSILMSDELFGKMLIRMADYYSTDKWFSRTEPRIGGETIELFVESVVKYGDDFLHPLKAGAYSSEIRNVYLKINRINASDQRYIPLKFSSIARQPKVALIRGCTRLAQAVILWKGIELYIGLVGKTHDKFSESSNGHASPVLEFQIADTSNDTPVPFDDLPSLISYMDASPEFTANMAMLTDEIVDSIHIYKLWTGMNPQ